MQEVLMFVANGTEEVEALMVVDLLRRAGIFIRTVSIHDKELVKGSHNIRFKADATINDITEEDLNDTVLIILPGGMPGTNNLMDCEKLREWIIRQDNKCRFLAAICAAPSILGVNGILKGKKATCYPGFEDKLIGAKYVKKPVVRDQNVITSRGLGTAIEFAAEIIRLLDSDKAADTILERIIYK